MARDITSGFQTEIEATELRPILLFKAEFDSGDLRFWSGYGDLTFDSEVYTGSGDLLKISTIEETEEIVANNVTIELSGIKSSLVSVVFTENYQQRPISCWFGALDSDLNLVADPYKIFGGFINIIETNDDGDTALFKVECESDLIDLKNTRERYFTDEDQKIDYPADDGLEFVSEIQDKELTFGVGVKG